MSAIEQLFLEREAAEHIRAAQAFVSRERLPDGNQVRRQARAAIWAVLALTVIALGFMIFLI
jgi:hypothetical protein